MKPNKEKTMEAQFKPEEIYLDLSKLSEEQRRKVIALLPKPINEDDYDITYLHFYLIYDDEDCMWWVSTKYFLAEKTEITYSQFLDMMGESEEVLQVENKISIDELTKLCNEYNISNLKISNLKRDLEYKDSWREESFAIQEIKKEISMYEKLKENSKSKLQEIGIVF